MWSAEYLRNLPAAVQSMHKSGNAKVGSVVFVREDGLPRMSWCFGLVTKLHYGKDGVPRAANITLRLLKVKKPEPSKSCTT